MFEADHIASSNSNRTIHSCSSQTLLSGCVHGSLCGTNGVLYLKTPINYNEKCDELWNEILKMCGLLGGVKKKLSNDKFVNRAKPEIVQKERDKQKYYEDKITITHQQLGMMEHYKLTSKK